MAITFALAVLAFTPTCRKPVEGSVFLKISKASSSFRTLMVSARAASSSERNSFRASHSSALLPQSFCRAARKPWSASSACSVSSRSRFSAAICTASSPTRRSFSSIAPVKVSISFFLALMRSPYETMEDFSSSVISFRVFFMSAASCPRMPVISPLLGMKPLLRLPERKARRSCRSTSLMAGPFRAILRTMAAVFVCRKPPDIPLEMAADALSRAWILTL
mmetsp:Transcript_96632/g.312115  ORF Transcript_96632/g.312115 Transcript_96632/m.312115 type:complete len:221 (+) Transcript_96632:1121-1783(+)